MLRTARFGSICSCRKLIRQGFFTHMIFSSAFPTSCIKRCLFLEVLSWKSAESSTPNHNSGITGCFTPLTPKMLAIQKSDQSEKFPSSSMINITKQNRDTNYFKSADYINLVFLLFFPDTVYTAELLSNFIKYHKKKLSHLTPWRQHRTES